MGVMKLVVRRRTSTKSTSAKPKDIVDGKPMPRIGVKLRHARLTKGLSLRQTADLAGCSESFLSKLENDRVGPSLAMLHKLATVLEINIAGLFDQDRGNGSAIHIFHPGDRPVIRVDPLRTGSGIALERVVPNAFARLLEGNIHIVKPGGTTDGTIRHEGEEVGYVLEGSVELKVDGKSYPLSEGDSFFFESHLEHGYINRGAKTAKIFWVNTPKTF